ncbi:hypothetical protein LVY75_12385 [Sinorhizobium sp. B11]
MSGLSPTFERFRRRRKRELMELGLNKNEAYSASKREARSRQAMVSLVGKEAALNSEILTKIRLDGTYSQLLMVPETEIAPDLRDRAEAWADSSDRPQAGSPIH